MKIGILGAGGIAVQMAKTVAGNEGCGELRSGSQKL